MNNDNLAIALDRLKFYARDAFVTVTQCICKPLYALKKILVTSGQEGVKEAMREVEAYRRFKHPNIIRILDSAVVQDEGGEGKIIYLFLPYYSRGNLQDIISASSVNGDRLPERKLLELFHGTCLAVRAMHQYHLPAVSASYPPTREDDPLVGEPVFDHDEELANAEQGELIPYAHRDIKPAPILMDFGSTIKARINVETRQQALLEQVSKTLDEKVDIWRPDIQKVIDLSEAALRDA
ncbi:hypothetical protein IAT38_000382 [Cryptococcus sp. DSM 104549]